MAFSVLQKGAGAASSTHVTFGSATTAGSCLIVLTVSNIAAGCGDCPPWHCGDCGEMSSYANKCSCWIDLTTMARADVKALFAADGTLNVGTYGAM